MADEEAEQDTGLVDSISITIGEVRKLLEGLHVVVIRESANSPVQSSSDYCQEFCRTLLEFVGRWKTEDEPLPLVQVYLVALLSFAKASPYLSLQCENVPLVIERLSLSFLELLLSLQNLPDDLWQYFKSSVQFAHDTLQENGITQLSLLCVLSQHEGIWSHKVLQSILSNENPTTEQVEVFLEQEGPVLLKMRVKQLMKEKQLKKAALLAKSSAECSAFQTKGDFKQLYLVCLCGILEKDQLMEELSKEDCHEALEMICNLESDGDDSEAFSLCSAFLTRQLLQGDTYCAWELTLFWSKLLKRLEPSDHTFLDRCRQMSVLSKSVYHILFLIKVIQSEITHIGLPVCIELCIMALRITSKDDKGKATVCKTISCMLPADLEVKRACQLTEFLLEPTVDSYYVVETLYNEPDQKLEEENMPIPNSLRCELLLVLKTQWHFDPEFWDWKTLKRHCLSLMGNEASIVSSIDSLNDSENTEEEEDYVSLKELNNIPDDTVSGTYQLQDVTDKKQKNREMKKLREKGFVSARFRNWQAYMQYCVLCDKEFLGHRIVRHAQIHLSSGIYTCPICVQTFTSKDTLLPHVTSHVKLSCKERLTAMKTNKALVNSKMAVPPIAILKAKAHNQIQQQNSAVVQRVQPQVDRRDVDINEDNVCPVGKCKRSFKFFKNLIAHVKGHGDNEEAKTFLELQSNKVVCQYCRRHFISVTHLNDHLQVHCGAKPYICIQLNCKASFLSNTKLLIHKKTHSVFKARCMFPNCGKIFNAPFQLYDHEAHHYKTFTCKALGCGKVFHSQQQLDLHLENHVNQDQESPPRSQPSANTQPGSSRGEQILSSQFPVKEEEAQKILNSNTSVYPTPGEFMRMQSFLETSQEHADTLDGCQFKPEPPESMFPTSNMNSSNNFLIQSVDSHLLDSNKVKDEVGHQSLDCKIPPQNYHPVHQFEASVGQLLQSLPHTLNSKLNTDVISYKSNHNFMLPTQQGPVSCRNSLAVSLPHISTDSAMLQSPPLKVNPQQLTEGNQENFATPSNITAPPTGQRERFHCAFGTCTKNYSCYRSVSKHMKAVHPDFYEQWKVARTEIRTSRIAAPNISSGPLSSVSSLQRKQASHHVQRKNIIQPQHCLNTSTASQYVIPHVPTFSQNPNSSLLMENVLNPVVLPQLGADQSPVTPQSQVSKAQNPVAAESEFGPHFNSSQTFISNQRVMSEIDSTSAVFPLGLSSCSVMGSKINQPESLTPQFGGRFQSTTTSCIQRSVELSQHTTASHPCTSQMQSSLVPRSKTPGKTKPKASHELSDFSIVAAKQNSRTVHPKCRSAISKKRPDTQKQARKHTRTKWPAIIKDGKFVCRRCFRQFDNPRSLGGHLSKRTVCKPYQESEINTDVSQSFLDLLNSEQTVTTSLSQPFYNGVSLYQKPDKIVTGCSSATKHYPTPQYPQNNLPTYENSQSSNNILKQLMAESSMSDQFVPPPEAQPLFQNSCASHEESKRLVGTSVIQHTETVQLKQAANSYGATHSPMDRFPGIEFSDPPISDVLTENSATAFLGNTPKISRTPELIFHESYPSKRTISTPDGCSNSVKQMLPDFHLSQAITSGMQTMSPVKTTDKDIKKRLREQILAGDFQRRNVCPANGNLKASNSVCSPSNNSGFQNLSHNAMSHSTPQGHVLTRKSPVIPEFSGEIEDLLNAQSFTNFRETPRMHIELPSPPVATATDVDPGPSELSATQQLWMTEIQCAFEKLDLVKDISNQLTSLTQYKVDTNSSSISSDVTSQTSVASTSLDVKPFTCENKNCTFSSISSDALWKHLSKTHNYTLEMVNVVKKRYGQYAPFKCQKCPKAFTRNSNLRIHYRTAHKLSNKEIADLDVKRRLAKAEVSNASRKKSVSVSQVTIAPITTGNHSVLDNGTHMCPLQGSKICQTYVPCANATITNYKYEGDNHCSVIQPLKAVPMHNLEHTTPARAQTFTSYQSTQAGISSEHGSKQQRNLPGVHAESQHFPLFHDLSATREAPPTHESGLFEMQTVVKPNKNTIRKSKGKKPKSGDVMSPYRPYRCVHQDCEAAFTIQQNLILHYRAVHQSALSALDVSEEHDESDEAGELTDHGKEVLEAELLQISEFRCQVKDCCCVFQEIPNLFQHYLQLHEFTDDEVDALLSGIRLNRFACGHQGCTETFIAFRKYKSHVKEQHKDLNFAKPEQLQVLFKCEIEGCDRSYATKSNMLRHMMKKHQELYQLKVQNKQVKEDEMKQNSTSSHYQITKTSNGKENIESNKKIPQRPHDRKKVDKSKSKHWLKYGKPSLKSKVDASALCTQKCPLQYPCMIKGCTSVMKSEKSILKHYIGHGLSEKYLEQHRSHFIFCKKFSRQKCRSIRSDDSKSENTSEQSDTEKTTDSIVDEAKYEYSKPVLRRRSPAEMPVTLFNTNLSNNKSSDGPVVLKRKRGRPRKFTENFVKPKKVICPTKATEIHCKEEMQTSPCLPIIPEETKSVPLASFKPMGFEMSFLKFLEQTNKSEQNLMRPVKVTECGETQNSSNSKKTCVWFSNHQNLKSLCMVKIKLDPAFSGVQGPMLKQLQDMDPAVVLEKCD
ncbi:zinc finger protein 292b [Girardinichthys multiradiatus]|uniref:zinc finger protein 292b n=1 Tax=Girardinichthys multiradiatus TaxID=208333 RepID=UPI001FABBBB6|nr:zinc finger protein 292b [Girardinichthys multiradiatus]